MMIALPMVVLSWRDGSGSIGAMQIGINAVLPVATIETAVATLATAVSAMTDAVLYQVDIIYRKVPDSGVTGAGLALRNNQGVFIFDCDSTDKLALINIPALKDALVVGSGTGLGVLIDTTNTDVLAFLDIATNGEYTNPFAEPIQGLAAAYRQSRV